MIGFKDMSKGGMWDWLQCKVAYDGLENAKAYSRKFEVFDLYSTDYAYSSGLYNDNSPISMDAS